LSLAVVYARVSTEDQARHGYSLPDQIARCRQKAKELGATTIVECVDEGISGDVLERPGLTEARQLIRDGGVSYFVCFDPDRLARKLSLQLLVTEEVEKFGCQMVFVNFEWKDTPEGKLFYSLRGAIAEFEKEKIRERTLRGIRRKALEGGLTLNPRAFGYDYNPETNSLEINPDEAQVYLMMSRWFLEEQLSYAAIARRLTEMGIPTKRGAKSWEIQTVRRMLTNSLYKGELIQQRYTNPGKRANRHRPPDQRTKTRERPQEEWVVVKVPAIIDEITYQKQLRQAERISRMFKARTSHGPYLLSGLMRCGLCGSGMSGATHRKNRYYRCAQRAQKSSLCPLPYIRTEVIDEPVWTRVCKWLEHPSSLVAALQSQVRTPSANVDLSVLERHLEEAAKERSRLIDLVQKGLVSADEIADRMADLGERIVKLKTKLAEHRAQQGLLVVPDARDITAAVERLRYSVRELDIFGKQRIIRELVDQIIVLPDELIIRARIPRLD